MRSPPSSDIIIVGSIRTGKNTIAKLLADQLAIPKVLLDDLRWKYYAEAASNRHRPFQAFQWQCRFIDPLRSPGSRQKGNKIDS